MHAKASAVLLAGLLSSTISFAEVTFTTLVVTPLAIEGLTGDSAGNLYTTGRAAAGTPCPVYRTNINDSRLVTVGTIPNPAGCGPSGITFDASGNLYIADGSTVWKLRPSETMPPLATAFATGVPGTNGLAFDRDGNLWTGDGTTGQGRVWKIDLKGVPTEMLRIQPMRNGTDLGGDLTAPGVGRQNNTVPTGTAQNLVANGLAFNHEGDLFVADTARGAIWKVQIDRQGNVLSPVGCDTTFTANTLCLDNVFVAHPYLEGTDGIALDAAGNIWNSVNERNAIVVVTKQRQVTEVFRTPPNAAGLRNAGVLEFPTSPFLAGTTFCTANSDGNRRDNSPNTAGEINSGGPEGARGKISCMEEELQIPGMPLPVR
jgi:sugar lactone lactonase YvrE